jgi:hypothetical protein
LSTLYICEINARHLREWAAIIAMKNTPCGKELFLPLSRQIA